MKTLFYTASVLFYLVTITLGCSNHTTPDSTMPENEASVEFTDKEFSGKRGQAFTVNIGTNALRFRIEEIRDNRCPKDAQCITAGAARVIIAGPDLAEFVLCQGADCQDATANHSVLLDGKEYEFELTEVNPYPGTENQALDKIAIFKIRQVTR